jgi:hypothetical protein
MSTQPSWDQSAFFVVDFPIAPVGFRGHLHEEASAAYDGLHAVTPGLADHSGNPGVGIGRGGSYRDRGP